MTFQEWQRHAKRELQSAGHDAGEAATLARLALDDAAQMRHAALLSPDTHLDAPQGAVMRRHLERLRDREPWPYITGRAGFYGLELEVSPATLIPRAETERLVDATLERLSNRAAPRVADLGTGTGAIALSIARARPDATVIAVELSDAARAIAARNLERHSSGVQLVVGARDWLSPLAPLAPFHTLVSNPPYIARGELASLQPEVRREPVLALDGGDDGLDPYRIFAAHAQNHLVPGGFCALEVGDSQFACVRALFERRGWRVEPPVLDFGGVRRVLIAHRAA